MDHELGAYVSNVQKLMRISRFVTLMTLFPDVELKVKKALLCHLNPALVLPAALLQRRRINGAINVQKPTVWSCSAK